MPEKKEIFEKIGVNVSDDNINIDLGKTKDFFNSLQNTLEEKAENIQKDISEGKVDLEENMGIKKMYNFNFLLSKYFSWCI